MKIQITHVATVVWHVNIIKYFLLNIYNEFNFKNYILILFYVAVFT